MTLLILLALMAIGIAVFMDYRSRGKVVKLEMIFSEELQTAFPGLDGPSSVAPSNIFFKRYVTSDSFQRNLKIAKAYIKANIPSKHASVETLNRKEAVLAEKMRRVHRDTAAALRTAFPGGTAHILDTYSDNDLSMVIDDIFGRCLARMR
jgi:hypothetical protein